MNKIAIIQIDIQDTPTRAQRAANSGYSFSKASWQRYAEKVNADYIEITESITGAHRPQWAKAFLPGLYPQYDRILYVDCDTLIVPSAPNIFEEYADESVIYAVANMGSMDWVSRSTELYANLFSQSVIPPTQYFNSGVLLFSKPTYSLFDRVVELYGKNKETFEQVETQYGLGTDQPVLNYVLRDVMQLIPYQWNMQDLICHDLTDPLLITRYGYVSHYNAGDKTILLQLMTQTWKLISQN